MRNKNPAAEMEEEEEEEANKRRRRKRRKEWRSKEVLCVLIPTGIQLHFVLILLVLLLFLVSSQRHQAQGIPTADNFALNMNRFSTADKLNRTRPSSAAVSSGFGTGGGFGGGNQNGQAGGGMGGPIGNNHPAGGQQQSYKDQLLSVILQNAANSSFPQSPPAASSLSTDASSNHQTAILEEPNGNMKSKDFGNGEGELDMLFGFFVMNGACIVFFLLFGVCVICNCAARKPKFHGSEQREKKRKKPTVSRLVAAMAPPGFGRGKAAKEAAASANKEQEQTTKGAGTTNIPMLQANSTGSRRGSVASIRLDQNGNGGPIGGNAFSPLIGANHSPSQRSSFRSLVARALASAKSPADGMSGDAEGGGGGGSGILNIETDADSSQHQPDPWPTAAAHHHQSARRQSKEAASMSSAGGPNSFSPARRMSALSSAIEESSRRISKLSHCSANAECCSLHVLEVPVEVEVHHCPSPTGSSALLPELAALFGPHHPKLASTRSMPLDLARAVRQMGMGPEQQPQQICLTEHGQFIVRRETNAGMGGWATGPFRSSSFRSKHRCSLVVPLQIPCGECRVQIGPDGVDDCGEANEAEITAAAGGSSGMNGRKKSSQEGIIEEEEARDNGEDEADGGGGGCRKPSTSGEFSVVRQNLLGPLSFDDLYYIT